MTRQRIRLGAFGEERTAQWYVHRGYEVLDRNWRTRAGEIDLVVSRDDELVFCEVKSRSTDSFGTGFDAVTPRKQARVRAVALAWLRDHPGNGRRAIRFDAASVVGGAVEVREGVF